MGQAAYHIVPHGDGWGIAHDGQISGDYVTKEAAFEAAVMAASNALKGGHGVTVSVEASQPGEAALGKA